MDKRIEDLTSEELASLLRGKGNWEALGVPRLSIPSFTMSDGPSGLRKEVDAKGFIGKSHKATLLPCPTLLAATFSLEKAREYGRLLGRQARSAGVDLLLGPGCNIQRDPRGGRTFEYFSEDPLLSGEMAAAYISGVQEEGTGSCLKHFAVNSQENERMTVDEIVDERALHEIYLRGFEIAVRKGHPSAVMASYNRVNNVHATESSYLLRKTLKEDWAFQGFAVSDWFAVNDPVLSLRNGLDLEMPQANDANRPAILESMADEKLKALAKDAVSRMLRFAERKKKDPDRIDLQEDHKKAINIAEDGMVLLKNDGILPLTGDEDIAIIGELANRPHVQGGGSSHVNAYKVPSFFEAVSRDYPFARGYSLEDPDDESFVQEALRLAEGHDVILLFLGLPDRLETEGTDRETLLLPVPQQRLLRELASLPRKVVVILECGGPVQLEKTDGLSAILYASLGGEGTNEAVSDLLFGKANPSGRLPFSYPLCLQDVPSYRDFSNGKGKVFHRESLFVGYRYYATTGKRVLFPFGHGLSYSSFQYSGLRIEDDGDRIEVFFHVKNVSERTGKAVCQLYFQKPKGTVFVPDRELAAFEKVSLAPGEERKVVLSVDKSFLSYYNVRERKYVALHGNYGLLVGESCQDIRLSGSYSYPGENPPSPYDAERLPHYFSGAVTEATDQEFLGLFGKIPETTSSAGITFDTSLRQCIERGSKGAKAFVRIALAFEPLKSNDMMRTAFLTSPLRVLCYNERSLSRNRNLLMRIVSRRFYYFDLLRLLLSMASSLKEIKKTN